MVWVRKGLHARGEFAHILGSDRHVFGQSQEVPVKQLVLAPGRHALIAEYRQGPEGEHETGLLFVILDHHKERPLLNVLGIGFHIDRLLLQEGVGLRPDQHDVHGVHQDKRHQQREYLVYQLDGKGSPHDACVPVFMRVGGQISTGKETALSARIFSEGLKVVTGFCDFLERFLSGAPVLPAFVWDAVSASFCCCAGAACGNPTAARPTKNNTNPGVTHHPTSWL